MEEDFSYGMGTGMNSGSFWSDPNNVVGIIGSSGDALGSWLQAFGVTQPNQQFIPQQPIPQQNQSMPAWAWILMAALLIGFIVIIILIRK